LEQTKAGLRHTTILGDDHSGLDRVDLEYVLCQIKSNNGYGQKISSNFAHERRSSGQGFEGGRLGTPLRYGGARGERRPHPIKRA
jgi:hypothetical protein